MALQRWQKLAAVGGGVLGVAGAAVAGLILRERAAEMPDYVEVEVDGALERRDYPALAVVEASSVLDRDAATNASFRRLAAYLSGSARAPGAPTRRIAMTAPVLVDRHAGKWRTRFILPAADAATPPAPGEGVALADLPARRVAALTFVGRATDERLGEHERTLRRAIAAAGERPAGAVEYAFYNSPAVPAMLRRTEVLIPIAQDQTAI